MGNIVNILALLPLSLVKIQIIYSRLVNALLVDNRPPVDQGQELVEYRLVHMLADPPLVSQYSTDT